MKCTGCFGVGGVVGDNSSVDGWRWRGNDLDGLDGAGQAAGKRTETDKNGSERLRARAGTGTDAINKDNSLIKVY